MDETSTDSGVVRRSGDGVVEQPQPLNDLEPSRIWGMLESAPDAMLLADEQGKVIAVNRQLELLFGYDRADLLGRSVDVLLPERFRDVHGAHRTRYRVDPVVRPMADGMELRARRADGSEFPVEVSLSPLHDDDGLAVVASVRDITDRLAAAAKVTQVQSAIDAVHDGVFMFDPVSLRFVYVNDGAVAQTGYTRRELLTMSPLHIKPDYTTEQFRELIAPLLTDEVPHVSFRTVHRHKTGSDVPVDIMLECRSSDADHPDPLLVALVRDVTERVAMEERLALSEQTFRTTFENAPVGMALVRIDTEGNRVIERANRSLSQMLGRSADSLIGVDFSEMTHVDDEPVDRRATVQMAEGSMSSYSTETRCRVATGGYVWTSMHTTVIDTSDGVLTLAHIVDVTDRRERQTERARLSMMEERDRIARDMHDLVIQRLFAAGMKLQAVVPQMMSTVAVERSQETIDELDATIRELRSAIFGLHDEQLAGALNEQIAGVVASYETPLGCQPALQIAGDISMLPNLVVTELLATLREALSNVARHAEASTVSVEITLADGRLSATVSDDGCGFDAGAPRGDGLDNMEERAIRLGGTCRIDHGPTGGTVLTWTVPH